MRRTLPLLLGLTLTLAGSARADDTPPLDEVFFREPDRVTAARIERLVAEMTEDGVMERYAAREELRGLSVWAVDPLISALVELEAPTRCAAALVLDAIRDRRALVPLREAMIRETSHPQVGGLCVLGLGRFRDASSVPFFEQADAEGKGPEMLRCAVPFALARVRDGDGRAAKLLAKLTAQMDDKEPIVSARLVSLGFFPDLALLPGTAHPSPVLERGLAAKSRVGERQAALIGYLVATSRRRDGKDLLLRLVAGEQERVVVAAALTGLAAYGDPDVTEAIARVMESQSPDSVRELAADILVPRGQVSTKPALLRVARSQQGARLRAPAVLALGRIDDPEAARAVLERLSDRASLVRAAAAVASVRLASLSARDEAAERIDGRLKGGETDPSVRKVLQMARSVLAGQRKEVVWPELRPDVLFSEVALTAEERLLRAVNLRLEACLDLTKIQILDNDMEKTPEGYPTADVPQGELHPSDPVEGGTMPSESLLGSGRTSAHPELRDLKVELRRRPYFTASDLPAPSGTRTDEGLPRK